MKSIRPLNFICLVGIFFLILNIQNNYSVEATNEKLYHPLASGPLMQDWSDPNLIVTNDDWSNVPSIEGFRGDKLINMINFDPQEILDPDLNGVSDVNANILTSPNLNNTFNYGVTEFENQIKSIAIAGSFTADAPYIRISLDTTTCSNIRVKYNVKDIEDSSDNSVQQVALHYRVGESGNFINLPEGYISDATEGPNKSGLVTPINVLLPSEADDQPKVQIRIMTTVYELADEWIAIDDIEVSGTCLDPFVEPIIPDCPTEITTYKGQPTNAAFSASDQDGTVSQASIVSDPIQGIQLVNIQPALIKGGALTGQLIIGDDSPSGEYEVELQFSNNDPSPQTASCKIPIHVIPQGCTQSDTHQIGEIQGAGSSSPIDRSSIVTTSGVVTATFFEGGIDGFYLQDPDGDGDNSTSDGLFVSHLPDSIEVGQPLQVTGSVTEYYGRTQLVNVTRLEDCGIPNSVSPIPIPFPPPNSTYFENYENMLVTFPRTLTINGHHNFERYGELLLGSQRLINPTTQAYPGSPEFELLQKDNLLDRIILDDGFLTYNPNPLIHPIGDTITLQNLFRTGDTLSNITGILDYAYGNYRIQPILPAQYTITNPRTSHTEDVGGTITVASFNVMNYFTTLGIRGAADETELTRQREKLFATITRLNADIIGLVEIENNEITVLDFATRLNAAIGADTYSFIDAGIIGVDEIKVALIYKPASVSPVGDFAILDANIDSRFNDDKNRPSLAQTFHDNANNKNFTIVVNHFKSKGSPCDDVGDPDLNDGAGNCNLTRLKAAQALVDWLATDPTNSKSNDILIIGDLNAYVKEDPIKAVLSGSDDEFSTFDDYTDLIYQFNGDTAYTYVYDGQLGYLDHALASNFLHQRVTGTTIWHINADEPNFLDYHITSQNTDLYSSDPYRSSDHDPILIGIDFSKDIAPIAFSQNIDPIQQNIEIQIRLEAIDEFNRPLTFRIVDFPENGTVELSDDLVTYTSKPNFSGMDTFSFVANNGIQDSNQATISLTIQPFNNPPSAKSDTYEIDQNQTLSIAAPGVLGNDSDPENDPLTAVLINRPDKGTLTIISDGSFMYKPEKDFTGMISFSYKAFDGKEYSSETIVTIKINPNQSPSENKVYLPLIVSSQ